MSDQALSKGNRRREAIMQTLKMQGRLSIQEIIEKFGCSEATARRDLDLLEKAGGIIRTIGGAQFDALLGSSREVSFQEKQQQLWIEKEAIAEKAASLIEEGDIVGLSGGTTTFLIARRLKTMRNITVVTNAVNIAVELADSDGVQVVVTGGVMRSKSFELCGPLAEKTVESLHISKMFLGVDGISIEQGMTTYSEMEAETAKLLIKRSGKTLAVFDHTKSGRASLFSVAPLSALYACVTDAAPDRALSNYLAAHHVALFVAGHSERNSVHTSQVNK